MRPARASWINPAIAITTCALAGGLFSALRLPLPWMIGPLLVMAGCNFAGAELRAPRGGRAIGQIVIGTALGLYFTPVVAHEVVRHWPLLVASGIVALLLGLLGGWVLSRVSGADRVTAFFASVPGGAAEMTLLGERYHARPDRVALSQSLRIVVVVVVVPFALTYSGAHGTDTTVPAPVPFDARWLALLLGAATLAGWALDRTRLANAYMFGPLALSIALTANDAQLSSIPTPLSNAAQALLGCALGARFERRSLQSAPRYVAGVLFSVLVTIAAAAAFGAGIALAAGLPVATLVLAMAPGGLAEMCITAKVLQLGVPLVTAAQVARVIVLILGTGPLFRFAKPLFSK
jgi:membrane AbrB-like protein